MSDDIEAWIKNYPPAMQELVGQMQLWVKAVLPAASEVLAAGYKMIMYKVHPKDRGFVVYIGPYEKHVNLGFLAGTSLPDPERFLEGTGKTLRHIKIRQASDLEKAGVRELVKAAWQHAISSEPNHDERSG